MAEQIATFGGDLLRASLVMGLSALLLWLLIRTLKVTSPRLQTAAWFVVLLQGWLVFSLPLDLPWLPASKPQPTAEPARAIVDDIDQQPTNVATVPTFDPFLEPLPSVPGPAVAEKPLPVPEPMVFVPPPIELFPPVDLPHWPAVAEKPHNAVANAAPSEFVFPPQQLATPAQVDVASVIPETMTTTKTAHSAEAPPSAGVRKFALPVLAVVWLSGIVVCLVRSLREYLRLRLALRLTQPAPENWQAEWQAVLSAANHPRSIPMQTAPGAGPAMALTERGYVVLVPRDVWGTLDVKQRQAILQHELTHLQRHDAWRGVLYRLLALPHWFNPCAWWIVKRLDECAEWACDEQAAADPALRRDYVQALMTLGSGSASLSLTNAVRGGRLFQRIERLLSPESNGDSRMKRFALLTTLAVLLTAAVVRPRLVAEDPPEPVTPTVSDPFAVDAQPVDPESEPPPKVPARSDDPFAPDVPPADDPFGGFTQPVADPFRGTPPVADPFGGVAPAVGPFDNPFGGAPQKPLATPAVSWEIETIRTNLHQQGIEDVVFSHNGKWLATTALEHTAKIWEVGSWRLLNTIKLNHPGRCLAFSQNDRFLIVGTAEVGKPDDRLTGDLVAYDVGTGDKARTLHSGSPVYCVACAPDGTAIIAGDLNGTIYWWGVDEKLHSKKAAYKTISAHDRLVHSLAWHPKVPGVFASGGFDGKIKLHKPTDTNKHVKPELNGHQKEVRQIAFTPDGKYLISASEDKTVRLWDVRTTREVRTLHEGSGWMLSLAVTPDGKHVAVGGGQNDERVSLIEIPGNRLLFQFPRQTRPVGSLAFSPDGTRLVIAGNFDNLQIWKKTGVPTAVEPNAAAPPKPVSLTYSLRKMAAVHAAEALKLQPDTSPAHARIVADPRTNTLTITSDDPQAINAIVAQLQRLDTGPFVPQRETVARAVVLHNMKAQQAVDFVTENGKQQVPVQLTADESKKAIVIKGEKADVEAMYQRLRLLDCGQPLAGNAPQEEFHLQYADQFKVAKAIVALPATLDVPLGLYHSQQGNTLTVKVKDAKVLAAIRKLIASLDTKNAVVAKNVKVVVYMLKHADVTEVHKVLNELYDGKLDAHVNDAKKQQLLVRADDKTHDEIAAILKVLDAPPQPAIPRVVPLPQGVPPKFEKLFAGSNGTNKPPLPKRMQPVPEPGEPKPGVVPQPRSTAVFDLQDAPILAVEAELAELPALRNVNSHITIDAKANTVTVVTVDDPQVRAAIRRAIQKLQKQPAEAKTSTMGPVYAVFDLERYPVKNIEQVLANLSDLPKDSWNPKTKQLAVNASDQKSLAKTQTALENHYKDVPRVGLPLPFRQQCTYRPLQLDRNTVQSAYLRERPHGRGSSDRVNFHPENEKALLIQSSTAERLEDLAAFLDTIQTRPRTVLTIRKELFPQEVQQEIRSSPIFTRSTSLYLGANAQDNTLLVIAEDDKQMALVQRFVQREGFLPQPNRSEKPVPTDPRVTNRNAPAGTVLAAAPANVAGLPQTPAGLVGLADQILAAQQNAGPDAKRKLERLQALAQRSLIPKSEYATAEAEFTAAGRRLGLLTEILKLSIQGAEQDYATLEQLSKMVQLRHAQGDGDLKESLEMQRDLQQARTRLLILQTIARQVLPPPGDATDDPKVPVPLEMTPRR